jgi:hypothetical protein
MLLEKKNKILLLLIIATIEIIKKRSEFKLKLYKNKQVAMLSFIKEIKNKPRNNLK